jgi:hypothetical protein
VEELQSKIRELETMQELIQQELSHVSTAASERGARLKCAAHAARRRGCWLPVAPLHQASPARQATWPPGWPSARLDLNPLARRRREVEAELEAVTRERDALVPSVEEIKWQLRKSEKKVDEVAGDKAELEQVGLRAWLPRCLAAWLPGWLAGSWRRSRGRELPEGIGCLRSRGS